MEMMLITQAGRDLESKTLLSLPTPFLLVLLFGTVEYTKLGKHGGNLAPSQKLEVGQVTV